MKKEIVDSLKNDRLARAVMLCERAGLDVREEREIVRNTDRLKRKKWCVTVVRMNTYHHLRDAVVESLIEKIETL